MPAVLLGSLFFTLWHLPPFLRYYSFPTLRAVVLLGVNVFPISAVLSVAYVRAAARNILGPILVHFLLDSLPSILLLAQLT